MVLSLPMDIHGPQRKIPTVYGDPLTLSSLFSGFKHALEQNAMKFSKDIRAL